MKITAIPSVVVPTVDAGNPVPSHVESIRKIKMQTNATPLTQALPTQVPNTTTEAVEATQPMSPQLALLAKQRRALQVKERELLAKQKELETRTSGKPSIEVDRLKAEPLRVLLENGVTYDQLTEAILANQGSSEIDALKAEINSLKTGLDQKFSDRDALAEKQVLAEMEREARQLIQQGEDFELVRETKRLPDVIQLISRTYKETGEVLDVTEALKLVEAELFKDAEKLAMLKKVQSKFMPPIPQPQQRSSGMRTLTNKDTASVPMGAKQRAMAAFYGTLPRG
jgi:hypothetical protein